MNWFDKLERKFGHFAIKGLMTYIVALNAGVYLLSLFEPSFQFKLMLMPSLVLKGEIWRLITYIFIPPAASPIWIIFILYFYYMIGSSLEHEWGSFRFNIYYVIGMICTTAAAFITGGSTTATYLNTSLFLAFAYIYPNYQILLFFVLPVKVKYLAWLDWIFIIITVLRPIYPVSLKVAAAVSVFNFFIFFGKDLLTRSKTNRQVYQNKKRFRTNLPKSFSVHKCTICGITEKENPGMDFRYCSSCEGDFEYCMDHLETHTHVKR